MRICIVMEYHPDDHTGGAEIQVFGLARQFAELGHQVFYVCQRYDHARAASQEVDGVHVLRVLHWHRIFRLLAGPRLFLTIRALKPDIIYQRFASPYTGLAALSARLVRVPFVWGCAEDVSVEGAVFQRPQPSQRERGFVDLVKVLLLRSNARVSQALFDRGVRRASVTIAQNSRQAELLAMNYGQNAVIIPNGVDLLDEPDERSPTPVVLWLNNLIRRKQPEVFIELARVLADRYPETEFAMVGGRADDGYLRDLRSLAAGIPGLNLYGHVPYSETASWFRRAWIYVLTSDSEGFPNVMLQAWATRTPVVSLSIDPDGLLERERLGLLSRSRERLRDDVDHLLRDTALREQLGARSRAFVSDHLQFAKIAERYLILFQELVDQ